MQRRNFIKKSALSVGSVVAFNNASNAMDKDNIRTNKLKGEIWIATVSQHGLKAGSYQEMNNKLLEIMEEIAPLKPDVVVLPEVAPFAGIPKRPPVSEVAEFQYGPITKPYAEYAKRNKCYVIISTYTKDEDGRFYNASVLYDRNGEYVGEYRKIYPTEPEMDRGITPGPLNPPVFETDFGRISMQICFDAEYVDGWRKLEKEDVDIVFFSSAYSAGKKLNSFATLFNYFIVSSTRKDDARIIDKTGEDIVSTGTWSQHWICAPVNLNKEVVSPWPAFLQFRKIEKKYSRSISVNNLHHEEITSIESLNDSVDVNDVIKEFKLETRQQYLRRVEEIQDKNRI